MYGPQKGKLVPYSAPPIVLPVQLEAPLLPRWNQHRDVKDESFPSGEVTCGAGKLSVALVVPRDLRSTKLSDGVTALIRDAEPIHRIGGCAKIGNPQWLVGLARGLKYHNAKKTQEQQSSESNCFAHGWGHSGLRLRNAIAQGRGGPINRGGLAN